MRQEIEKVISEIRPYLQAEDGDIELIDIDEGKGIVKVKLTGACGSCPMSVVTLKATVEQRIKQKVPQVKEVIAI